MPEWLVERGIGETRAALVESGAIVEARVELDDILPAGSIVAARLASIGSGGRNAVARTDDGVEILLPKRPIGISEGSRLSVEITRSAIPGAEPWKRPLGRGTAEAPRAAPPLAQRLGGVDLPPPIAGQDVFQDAGWPDLLEEARSETVQFAGGRLRISATPAMTLIDVDGSLPILELAVAGAAAAASAIRRLDIGGNIGIDLPTVHSKAARAAVGEAVDAALAGTAFERTAMNGFGFLQVVRPRRRASLIELATDRAPFEARALLRRAALDRHGSTTLVVPSAVASMLERRPNWLDALSRQIGGPVTLRTDPSLPIHGAYAQGS